MSPVNMLLHGFTSTSKEVATLLPLKNPHRAADAQKTPTGHHQKTPTGQDGKTPSYYTPRDLYCLVSFDELTGLLKKQSPSQYEWCSQVRLTGLLVLLDFFAKRDTKQGVTCSAGLARDYISKLGRAKSTRTIKEPLQLLVKIGLLDICQKAVNGWHVKTSAKYRIHPDYQDRRNRKIKVALPPKLLKKVCEATERQEKRLIKRQPFRECLLGDLGKLSIASEGRSHIAELLRDENLECSTLATVKAIDGHAHFVKQSARKQITTSISSCPRRMKSFLLLNSERTVSCDISHAHHCFLPRIIKDRIGYLHGIYGEYANVRALEAESKRLVIFLSEGDYYRKLSYDPESDVERDRTKHLVNVLLNMPTPRSFGIALYTKLRQLFPLTFDIIEDIKKEDHRNISKPLQSLTATAINSALIEAQKRGIASIPEVDAIICQEQHKDTVCEIIGRKVYEISGGVTCKVGGIRYVVTASSRKDTTPIILRR